MFPKSKCVGDCKEQHHWESIGFQDGYRIWICTQCHNAFKETLKFIN